ncbi:MAG: CopG family transcriptional regulator [Chloroflexota bacterium]|nr:CopG family transcriptional regulator [Chloroflexota bacterium]
MDTQNITLSLPKAILMKVKVIAVQQQISVSGLLTRELQRLVRQEEAYGHAHRRHMQLLDRASDLGTNGEIKTSRDELHERR